MKQKTW